MILRSPSPALSSFLMADLTIQSITEDPRWLSQRHLKSSGLKLDTLLCSLNLFLLLCPLMHRHSTSLKSRHFGSSVTPASPSLSTHSQLPALANTTSHICSGSSFYPPFPESLAGNSPKAPRWVWLSLSLFQSHLSGILISSYPTSAQSLDHSLLCKWTVSLQLRGLLQV